jgi:cyclophilin family peptidyl-prolyl cis-trans isomerase
MKAYMTISHGSSRLGRLELELYETSVPKTVKNFAALIQNGSYQNCKFHRIISGFMAQGGDYTRGDGTGGSTIYGKEFADETFNHFHTNRGMLSMANSGPNTNGSQFFITFRATPHLDGKHVVFGHVNLASSAHVLDAMEQVATGRNDVPRVPVVISECGVYSDEKQSNDVVATKEAVNDSQEIELEEEEAEVEQEEEPAQEEEDDGKPKTKQQQLRERLRKLKMKTNQARQLNRQEVVREGERLGSEEGAAKERKRLLKADKKLRQQEWESRNAKALELAAEYSVDGKALVEPALDSIKRTTKKAEKAEATRYAVNDYYNPEGQHRNYQRNVASLPSNHATTGEDVDTSTFNPIMAVSTTAGDAHEREGARRLANELKRRIEKKEKNKRKRNEFDATDVGYINQRNKRFNEKISRNYDEHTAEIRQNLERGTAL